MASVLPDKVLEQLEFCEAHLPAWTAAPATAIGLTAGQLTSLGTITTATRTAYNAAQAARNASKAATNTLNTSASGMRELASDLIRTIKAFADLQTTPGTVYSLAQIPQPLPPTPMPAPGKPTDFQVVLEPGGSITLSWAGEFSSASSGSFYNVFRKLPGQTGFTMLGGASGSTTEQRRMRFTDGSVPSSAAGTGASYIVQGQRGTNMGLASDILTVEFGVDGGAGLNFKQFANDGGQTSNALRVAA
jgi:hypothetical protein